VALALFTLIARQMSMREGQSRFRHRRRGPRTHMRLAPSSDVGKHFFDAANDTGRARL